MWSYLINTTLPTTTTTSSTNTYPLQKDWLKIGDVAAFILLLTKTSSNQIHESSIMAN
jgi:hypothetical protein